MQSMKNKIFLTNNLSLVSGDMFLSKMQTLAITVNTVGVMGKGIVLTTKNLFPDMYLKYKELCQNFAFSNQNSLEKYIGYKWHQRWIRMAC
jgi:uncharacterized protein YlxW (UPF0749 family)